ncbi:malectin domain-containing carbohydrate-binding protein [Flavobacterium seoulense]|uniref:Glycoside hydrolase n=1 Tax=Flavobacterium seoulense TaxID=1492738 RepID=A0A066X0T0_9FLAO|nr:malectin domain-containing carbohydrate-binding protein [Flavobacterium seoulense]KDN56530.1 glycoside hydrolase [Flavobacterium seoulense]
MKKIIYILSFITTFSSLQAQKKETSFREEVVLDTNWKTTMVDSHAEVKEDFATNSGSDANWKTVSIPHNWDQYEGFRQMKHGNLHGTAWYSRNLKIGKQEKGKKLFLFFEGVNSYATVWVNGKEVGQHKGGRTTFTLDISNAVKYDANNRIVVKAAHPAFIADLPWVCGGCSGEWGFSEGSQPMGIFRPVTLITTNDVRIAPFGIHIWNDETVSKEQAILHTTTEIQNYSLSDRNVTVISSLLDKNGKEVASVKNTVALSKETKEIGQTLPTIKNPNLWSPENPYLYTLSTTILEKNKVVDKIITPYGIRWVSWPVGREGDDKRFFINDKPVFINGTCEYEHQLGQSHAFSNTQIKARIEQIKAAGFNSFREAHQPHNLKYQELLDESGILFWSQFSAHIWYDTPEFKDNFKTLLREWIKERRNNPSVVLWGLQNESTIPKEFAEECTKIIREMDPTASAQRKVTTCNGGEGTDWNVVQNWSGTYGGDPFNYAVEMTTQLLNGEYGAWRSHDLHTEGEFDQKGILSENRFSQLMEIKISQAESVKDKMTGQFNWLFSSHENPGREQNGEGFRAIDQVGPVNYKGLFSIWGEPLDAYYLYRANYASKKTNPMVYIVSHTWPNRWEAPGIKNGIDVYSNCDEVELFNDVNNESLGKLKNPGVGQHFQWNKVNIKYNVLYAVGYVNGKKVAQDYIVLNNLPEAPSFKTLSTKEEIVVAKKDYNYIYRVNCGGPDFIDADGNQWLADVHKTKPNTWGSVSWADDFKNVPAYFASQRSTSDLVDGTQNDALFQTFRYGMDKLKYEFPVPDGEYLVDLYFSEPWYGSGGGLDCKDWRVFDVAINNSVVIKDFDIWKEVGFSKAIKKTVMAKSKNGQLVISFPKVTSGEGIISAIAIASKEQSVTAAAPSPKNILNVTANTAFEIGSWLNTNQRQYLDRETVFTELPPNLYTADYIRFSDAKNTTGSFISKEAATVSVLIYSKEETILPWLADYKKSEATAKNSNGVVFTIFEKEVKKGETVFFGDKGDATLAFTIVVVPTSDLGKVKDDRPSLKLEAETAKIKGGGTVVGNFKSSDYVEFAKNTPNSIEFEVNPGVANIYLMRFRYMNLNQEPIKVKLIIEDAYGILMRNDEIEFPAPTEKWKVLNTTSGGYINAGKYKIRIESDNMKGLRLESMEFQ